MPGNKNFSAVLIKALTLFTHTPTHIRGTFA